jgi:L-Ala-D/L-Glu epimerase
MVWSISSSRKPWAACRRHNGPMMALKVQVGHESWPIAGSFTIARGSKTAADVIVATLSRGPHKGHGEAVPYARYNETVPDCIAAIEAARGKIEACTSRADLQKLKLPKAALNALDAALWDLESKETGTPSWQRAGLLSLKPVTTCYTLSLDTAENMAAAAKAQGHRPLLKLKLGREGDIERLHAIRRAAPNSTLVIDANEGWRAADLPDLLKACRDVGIALVEQPLPADADDALRDVEHLIPICADESAHGIESLEHLRGKYDAINIKLDKTGGLTPALQLADAARAMDFKIMVGCMLATSLAMAPAFLIAQKADIVDLDGPLLLKQDREHGFHFEGSAMHPPNAALWG